MYRFFIKHAFYLVALIAMIANSGAFAAIDSNLVAYWGCDEGSGNTVNDSAGGHTGMLSAGIAFVDDTPSNSGTALDFTAGGDPLITVEDAPDLNNWDPGFTVAMWLCPRGGGSLMDKSESDGVRVQWYVLGDQRMHWGHGSSWGFSDDMMFPAFGEWHHVAWTHDMAQSVVYIDGNMAGTTEFEGPIPDTTGAVLYFGNRLVHEGRSEWYNGKMDEIGLWKTGHYLPMKSEHLPVVKSLRLCCRRINWRLHGRNSSPTISA